MNRLYLLLLFLFLLSPSLYAQKLPFKFGYVKEAEIKMTACDFYPEAKAMVLGEYGVLNFLYDDKDGWKYELKTAVRKKIFDRTAANHGTVKLKLYSPVKSLHEEEIIAFKGFTHNWVDGKVKKEKIDKKDLFTTRLNDYWVEVSFALPNIQKGTVIEYTYTQVSDYLNNLTTWHFQHDIPVAVSDFRYTIPEWFNYQLSQLGYLASAEWETKTRSETFTYNWKSTPQRGGRVVKGTDQLKSISTWKRAVMTNIPPLEEEPHRNNLSDIPGRLEFQLISTQFPDQTPTVIAGDYASFNQQLINSSNFGSRLNKGKFITKAVGDLTDLSTIAQAKEVYNHLIQHFSWNKIYTFTSAKAGKPAYTDAKGNVADINLSLVAALRQYGIKAYPVVLSTRGHGSVHPIYPDFQDFNYVIAAIVDGEELYFADATTALPFGQLPLRCRNGQAWLVQETGGTWVDLKMGAKYAKATTLNATLTEGKLRTKVVQKHKDYAAHQLLQTINQQTTEGYPEVVATQFETAEVQALKLPNMDAKATKTATLQYDLVQDLEEEEVLYIQPITTGSINKNPFQRAQRFSVIDFPYTQSYTAVFNLTIPEGYTAEIPESAIVKLPDNKGKFIYSSTQTGNKINILSKVKVSTTLFSLEEYQTLQEFYEMIVTKNQEPIVLSKAN